MKKYIWIFVLLIAICAGAVFLPQKDERYDYLRLHIRANSNLDCDQQLKYKIKEKVVEILTPFLINTNSKEAAIKVVKDYSAMIKGECLNLIRENGFSYSVNIKVSNEYFPTRTYSNTTLNSGYYDAVIVELGEAKGDNWWCVMYPPLCFVNKNENNAQIKYKSAIVEWLNKWF